MTREPVETIDDSRKQAPAKFAVLNADDAGSFRALQTAMEDEVARRGGDVSTLVYGIADGSEPEGLRMAGPDLDVFAEDIVWEVPQRNFRQLHLYVCEQSAGRVPHPFLRLSLKKSDIIKLTHAGPVVQGVFVLLVLASVWCWAIIVRNVFNVWRLQRGIKQAQRLPQSVEGERPGRQVGEPQTESPDKRPTVLHLDQVALDCGIKTDDQGRHKRQGLSFLEWGLGLLRRRGMAGGFAMHLR